MPVSFGAPLPPALRHYFSAGGCAPGPLLRHIAANVPQEDQLALLAAAGSRFQALTQAGIPYGEKDGKKFFYAGGLRCNWAPSRAEMEADADVRWNFLASGGIVYQFAVSVEETGKTPLVEWITVRDMSPYESPFTRYAPFNDDACWETLAAFETKGRPPKTPLTYICLQFMRHRIEHHGVALQAAGYVFRAVGQEVAQIVEIDRRAYKELRRIADMVLKAFKYFEAKGFYFDVTPITPFRIQATLKARNPQTGQLTRETTIEWSPAHCSSAVAWGFAQAQKNGALAAPLFQSGVAMPGSNVRKALIDHVLSEVHIGELIADMTIE